MACCTMNQMRRKRYYSLWGRIASLLSPKLWNFGFKNDSKFLFCVPR